MEWTANPLELDPKETVQEITAFIQHHFRVLNRRVVVVGLSGGLDSSLTAALAVKALGSENVKLFYLPDRDSKPIHRKHAILMADQLDADLKIIKITPALRVLRIYSLLPLNYFPGRKLKSFVVNYVRKNHLGLTGGSVLNARLSGSGGAMVSRANAYINAKHRLRTVILFREAEKNNGLVVGAANKTEWLTGTFVQFGVDHSSDLMPLLHLYRSQLEKIAKFENLPDEILEKESDTDILPGVEDKGKLLGSYVNTDFILWGLENNVPMSSLEEKFGQEKVQAIKTLFESSRHYREVPYSLV
jgi:NAD+ synthase